MPIKLKKGYTFFYDNKSWKVTEVYKTRWNDGTKSEEFKIKTNLGIIRYLEIEIDGEDIDYSIWEKITNKRQFLSKFKKLEDDYVSVGNAKFPKVISYKGVDYKFVGQSNGVCSYDFETERVDSIDYANKNNTRFFSIEVWDDEVEISTGIPIQESDIKQIEKGKYNILNSSVINFIGNYIGLVLVIVFVLTTALLQKCSNNNSWNDDSRYSNDSTKVHRSNNYYRGRSSGGFGK